LDIEMKGPRGTLKMLVDGAGEIKMTKVGFPFIPFGCDG